MRSAGYTLIELLVVISIIGILSVVAFVNIKDFSSNQALKKAAGDIQSFLRLAQANATSSTFCGSSSGVDWTVTLNANSVVISCPLNPNYKILTLQSGITINPTFSVVYSALKGVPSLSSGINWTNGNLIITLNNSKGETKTLVLTSGGGINVQ